MLEDDVALPAVAVSVSAPAVAVALLLDVFDWDWVIAPETSFSAVAAPEVISLSDVASLD